MQQEAKFFRIRPNAELDEVPLTVKGKIWQDML